MGTGITQHASLFPNDIKAPVHQHYCTDPNIARPSYKIMPQYPFLGQAFLSDTYFISCHIKQAMQNLQACISIYTQA